MVKEAHDLIKKYGLKKEYLSEDETPEETIKTCLKQIPINQTDILLDAGSGQNKLWFKNFQTQNTKYECEIKDGNDFILWTKKVDWTIGNPPYKDWIEWCFKSTEISNKGFAFLINHTRLNQLTPHRLNVISEKGFYLSKIHIIEVKKWFGRYYLLIFTKQPNEAITW